MISYLSKADKKVLRGTALLRLDFNAEDEWRMRAALPTIHFLLKHSDKIIILSHRGRPEEFDKKLSLKKDAATLAKLLGKKIAFIPHLSSNTPRACRGERYKTNPFRWVNTMRKGAGFIHDLDLPKIKKSIGDSKKGSIFVLENLRFFKGEAKNDKKFAKKLASLGDFYVNDAFAVSHRKNTSIVAITEFLPSFAGLELEKEIRFLSKAMLKPKKPLVVILGGAKAHDKLGVLKYFKNKADCFLIGGASANTLLFISGVDIKSSLMSKDKKDIKNLRRVLNYKNLIIPTDVKFQGEAILDIGERTAAIFSEKIKNARTIIWSGPMGAFEEKGFSGGTLTVAKAIAKNKKAFSVVGGGETVSFLEKHGLNGISKNFSFVSTGGGAMLDFLAGNKLPGIAVLERTSLAKCGKLSKGGRRLKKQYDSYL